MLLDPEILLKVTTTIESLCDSITRRDMHAARAHIATTIAWLSHLADQAAALEFLSVAAPSAADYSPDVEPLDEQVYTWIPNPNRYPN